MEKSPSAILLAGLLLPALAAVRPYPAVRVAPSFFAIRGQGRHDLLQPVQLFALRDCFDLLYPAGEKRAWPSRSPLL
jgi:hypothetical protein